MGKLGMTRASRFTRWAPWVAALCTVTACERASVDAPAPARERAAAQAPTMAAPVLAPVAEVESSAVWLDLLAQRPSAVLHRDGALVVDLGQPHAQKHVALAVRNQWALARSVDGRAAGLVVGRTASLDLPLDGPLSPAHHPDAASGPALALALELRALQPDQSVTVLWNERPLANLTLSSTWERRTLSLPRESLRVGENRLRLHFRRSGAWEDIGDTAGAVARVEVGPLARIREPPNLDVPPFLVRASAAGEDEALLLGPGTTLAYYLAPPRRARLLLHAQGHGALRIRVSTDEDHRAGREPSVLFEEALRPGGHRTELDLGAWGGEPIRIEMGLLGSDSVVQARIDALTVVSHRSVPVDRRARQPRDIVIVAVEGARADAFSFDRLKQLPHLEALMAESLVFERAYAASPAAVPSHAAWWTSVAPSAHLTVRGTYVADAQTSFSEALARAGYFRALVTANPDVSEERGLLQGFDVHRRVGGGHDAEDDSALAVVRTLLAEARPRPDRWLLYANVNDPQAPYEPPRDVLRNIVFPEGMPLPHLTHLWVGRVRIGKTIPGERELAFVRNLYQGELQVVDRAIGELVDALRSAERLDAAILVVVGVHGEEFFEHGGAGHGMTLHEESLRVPLVIRAPELLAPGRVEAAVDLLDLAPTLADLTGVRVPAQWQGESLVPVIDDPQPSPRLVVGYLGDGSRSALVGDAKYILGPGRRERYFDLRRDPKESQDLLEQGGIGLRWVRTALAWQLAHEQRWRRARWGTGANLRRAFALDQGM